MQPIIHLLSDETINQIAAGEVIESPASVVKELVENSLDAQAKKITIEITGGGLKLIRITDDGSGMHGEDAVLCVKRHSTSKISRAQDLFHLMTKGFRGEALAAVASISKMTLMTALHEEKGTKLEIEKGEVFLKEVCARNQGTTIEIRSLFYNVPARKNFQKSAAAIGAEIFRVVSLMALSHPEVQFELITNGRSTLVTRGNETLEERVKGLLGTEFLSGSLSLAFEEGPLQFSGFLGQPTQTRNNKTGQYLFINKRAVSCGVISEAVREGYGTRMDAKRHPIFLMHLNLPSDLVDVNVHPQKLQVRLRSEDLFREKVKEAVEKTFAKGVFPVLEKFTFISSPFVEKKGIPFQFEEREERKVEEELFLPLEQDEIEVLGQTGIYMLFKDPEVEGVMLLDCSAASFRVAFENFIEKSENFQIEKQGLLFPFSIDLFPIEAAMILTHQDAIETLGFSLRAVAKDIFLVEAIPLHIEERDVKRMICQMADELQEFIGKIDYKRERLEKLALIVASFVKNRKNYSSQEAKGLYKKLKSCKSSTYCPKGSLTTVHLSHEAIEDLFTAH